MPAAAFSALSFYGPGCAAAVGADVTPTAFAELRGNARLDAVGTAVAFSPLARGTQGKAMAAVNTSAAFSPLSTMRGTARLGAIGKVNELSQDDVTGAVLESFVEPGITLKQALRALLATSALGRTTGAGTTENRFRDPANTKDRIVATFDGSGNRVSITADLD